MNRTPRLRFVERQQGFKSIYGTDSTPNMVRVLQQWWEPTEWAAEGFWLDVPVEKEE